MGLSRTASICRGCPISDICHNKKLEELAYMEPVTMPNVAELMEPMAVKHDYRDVKVSDCMTIEIDVEELKRILERTHYRVINENYMEHGA